MMISVTEADRKAAEELRAVLADASGFWHLPGDDGPLCIALAQHRERTELHLLTRMHHAGPRAAYSERTFGGGEAAATAFEKPIQRARHEAVSR
jgi:hypothetical protein